MCHSLQALLDGAVCRETPWVQPHGTLSLVLQQASALAVCSLPVGKAL